MFLLPTKACFLTRTSTNTISRCIFYKTEKLTKFKIFDPNQEVTLLEKWEFCSFYLNRCFHSPASLVYYIKRQKWFFTMFNVEIMEATRSYRKLQGVTGDYKGLRGVTKDYRRLVF